MTSNDGEEFPWKTVAKGRRSKKPVVRVAATCIEAEEKSSKGTEAKQSKPEKLGVSVLGQHFAEKVEHVPIKRRTFMVGSPSPSKKSSAQREGSVHIALTNPALLVSRLNTNSISYVRDENLDCSAHNFSGMKLLDDAACRFHVSNDHAPAVDRLLATEVSVEGNDSSAGTVDVSHTAIDSSDLAGQGKSDNVASQKSPLRNLSNDLADDQSVGHNIVTYEGMITPKKISITVSDESSTERPKANVETSENEALAPDSGTVTVSDKSHADVPTEKKKQDPKKVRLHWDLNLPMDAWDQPCDVEDVAYGRDLEGEITESSAPKESEPVNGSKDHMDGVIASDGHTNFSSSSGPKAEVVATYGKECESSYDSQFEDGEWREPYPWVENEGDTREVEHVDYGSERKDDKFYPMVESNDIKMEDYEKRVLADKNFRHVKCESGDALRTGEANKGSDTTKQVVVNMSDSHPKKGSSSHSRSFGSKPFKELPSHDAIQRRRPDNYEGLSTCPNRFAGRDDMSEIRMRNRSPRRGYISGWDSKQRFSPPNYKGDSYGFGRPQPKSLAYDRGMMDIFDESGSRPGTRSDGYVHRQFSNGGYQGRFRRFPDGGDRDFRGLHSDTNQFPGRMHNRMSGNRRDIGNSPVFRRLHYPQSESRSISRSPVSWNSQNRSSPPSSGFRADEMMMETVRLPFQNRFPTDQEMGYMSPPRNRMSSSRFFEGRNNDGGENQNSLRERKFWPGQRFNVGNTMRRPNSNNNNNNNNNDGGENQNSLRERKFWPGQRFNVGNSMRRPHSNNNNNNHFRPFIRKRRFDGAEENTSGNRFEMAQQQQTRPSKATEDDDDDIRRIRFKEEQPGVVTNDNDNDNNNKES